MDFTAFDPSYNHFAGWDRAAQRKPPCRFVAGVRASQRARLLF